MTMPILRPKEKCKSITFKIATIAIPNTSWEKQASDVN